MRRLREAEGIAARCETLNEDCIEGLERLVLVCFPVGVPLDGRFLAAFGGLTIDLVVPERKNPRRKPKAQASEGAQQ